VSLLEDLSGLHLRHDNPEAARAALQRAIDILQALPGHEQRVAELHDVLNGLPPRQAA
jgi:hypothetical protein